MKEPSSAWTPEERLEVVAAIAREMQKFGRIKSVAATYGMLHIADCLFFVATMPPAFLEANRKQILEGLPLEKAT